MAQKIELRGKPVPETTGVAPGRGGQPAALGRKSGAEIPSRAAAVVDRVVFCWRDLFGLQIDRHQVFEHMERLRKWQTRQLGKSATSQPSVTSLKGNFL